MIKNKISVIMPTYNHAPFVEKAIQSVLGQRDVDFEFLISDDGSSDNTQDVVSSISDDRILFFPNAINRGACVVTNELIEKSCGEYIALINSDDVWVEDKLSYQLNVMQGNPELAACFGRAQFIDKDGNNISKDTLPFGQVFDKENRTRGQWLRYFFEHGNCLCHPTIMARRAVYDEVGLFSNRLRQLPDFEMWIRFIKQYPIFVSERELINFRLLPGENASSQSEQNATRTLNEHFLIASSFFNDVTLELFLEAFSDVLDQRLIPSKQHFDVEKALLFFRHNQLLGNPYKVTGLLELNALLNSDAHRKILSDEHGIDDRWFQNKMGEVDVLCLRPACLDKCKRGLWSRVKNAHSIGGIRYIIGAILRRLKRARM